MFESVPRSGLGTTATVKKESTLRDSCQKKENAGSQLRDKQEGDCGGGVKKRAGGHVPTPLLRRLLESGWMDWTLVRIG
jgi:hypothetical protein